jgi:cathepsin A (carboxypeptidase C)
MPSALRKALIFSSLAYTALAGPNAAGDLVPTLQGQATFSTFTMYSGYLTLPKTTTKALHYVLATSQSANPTTDPVIIWFNGGPGCSSMLGWAQELGPYKMENGETTFEVNPYAWNLEANLVFIESPGGVGYSICGDATECDFTDDSSSQDNLDALLYFFNTLFPEYKTNDLYISGESYAGIYVPYLADKIDSYNTNAQPADFHINLKGFMVGNGCTNWNVDCNPAYLEMGYWHGLYFQSLYDSMTANDCEKMSTPNWN